MADNATTAAGNDALKEKVRKVLALLEGAKTEGEAHAASLALQRLLAKTDLSVEDVIAERERECKEDVVERTCKAGDSSSNWKIGLAHVIANNYRCELYLKRSGRTRSVVFVGLEEDAGVATGCFHATVKAAQRCFRSYCKWVRSYVPMFETSEAGFRNGYYYGFVKGLGDAYREQVESSEELAIVLQTPAVVRLRMDEIRKRLTTSKMGGSRINGGSYSAGQRDGYGFGRGDRLEG